MAVHKGDIYLGKTYPLRPYILEALFNSNIIDTHKGREMGIFYVPGSYLNADMPEEKFIILK